MTHEELAAFRSWRASRAENEAAYRESMALWGVVAPALREAGPSRERKAWALPVAVSRRQMLAGGAALGAAALMLPLAIGMSSVPANATVFETAKGERRRETLPDGLVLELNTETRLASWLEEDQAVRRLLLNYGEALVSVGYDAQRGLLAAAGDTEVRARQAQFLLRLLDGENAQVHCLAGEIEVRTGGRSRRLRAAETTRGPGPAMAVAPAEARNALDWRRGVIAFEGRSAGDVVAELNRYRAGRVVIPARYEAVPITGVIHTENADAAVDHLADLLHLQTYRLPGGLVLLRDK